MKEGRFRQNHTVSSRSPDCPPAAVFESFLSVALHVEHTVRVSWRRPKNRNRPPYLSISPVHSRDESHHGRRRASPDAESEVQRCAGDENVVVDGEDCVRRQLFDLLKSVVQAVLLVQDNLNFYDLAISGVLTRNPSEIP